MGIRPKLLILFVVLGFVPMLVLGIWLYQEGIQAVETDLSEGVVRDADAIANRVDSTLRESETSLATFARSPVLRTYVNGEVESPSGARSPGASDNTSKQREGVSSNLVPENVRETVQAFFAATPNRYSSITCLNTSGMPRFRAEPVVRDRNRATSSDVEFKTGQLPESMTTADGRVWNTSEQTPLRSPLTIGSAGAAIRYSVPVFVSDAGSVIRRGVVIAELNVDALVNDAIAGTTNQSLDSSLNSDSKAKRFTILLDHDGDVLYHTNEVLRHQNVDAVIPTFKDISSAMIRGESGWRYYEKDGAKWIVAYRSVPNLKTYVGVAGDFTEAIRGIKRIGWITLALYSLFGLVTILVLGQSLQNTARGIERVTEGAVAIAGGRLEQRIEVRSNDETRLLAESFNVMTDRLREQIARETESRQFESFMRLSAMMTHDLKNAIASLMLLVGNLERQFHREEFRADAMSALTGATEKLGKLVSKLSEPVQSLSSEHQAARPIDLIPIIRNALVTTIDLAREEHVIEVNLPESLIVKAEPDRIEKVFENLIMNALEAMGAKNGKLTVEAGKTEIDEVYFSVSDTGPGMSEEFQRVKLFRAFATTKKNGIGLGLYTCREILQAHGGRIEVTSQRGSGATFRAVLPSQLKTTSRK